ncbi:MAG: alpha/beta fold hydrolase [Candidatus Limnocylindrales bacterium]
MTSASPAEPALPGGRGARRHWRRWLAVAVVLIVGVVAAGVVWLLDRATPAAPTAFYTPPDPRPSGSPGTIIRSEPITSGLPPGARAERILYQSTGVSGEPVAVSGIVISPADAGEAPRPIVAWAHGTVGVVPACGTSHAKDPFQFIPELALLVNQGFVVAATDYPGLGTPGVHPYLVGPVAAASVLDSVRAARSMDIDAGDGFVVWGHSQGGASALWTGQEAAAYAPELRLLGVAAAAPATDLAMILAAGHDTKAGAVLGAEALYSWSENYPDAALATVVKSEHLEQVRRIAQVCITTPAAFLLAGDLPTPDQFLAVDPLTTEPWRTIISDNSTRGPIDAPMLITHGTADGVIPFAASEAEVARRCGQGEAVQFLRIPEATHQGALDSTDTVTVGWIEDRFAGRPAPSSC